MSNQMLKKILFVFLLGLFTNGFNLLEAAQKPSSDEKESKGCLDLSCRLVTDEFIEALIKTREEAVLSVNLTGCKYLIDKAVKKIVEKWPGIEFFFLNGCTGLTDQALMNIKAHCTQLEELSIAGCTNIQSMPVLRLLVRKNKQLKHLDISQTPLALDTKGLETVRLINSKLVIYTGAWGCIIA